MEFFKDKIVEDRYVSDEIKEYANRGMYHQYHMVGNYRLERGFFSSEDDVPLLLDDRERKVVDMLDFDSDEYLIKEYGGYHESFETPTGDSYFPKTIRMKYLIEHEDMDGEVRLSVDAESSPFKSILNGILDGKKILDTDEEYLFTDDPDFLSEIGLDDFSYGGIYKGIEEGSIGVKGENSEMLADMLGKIRPKTMTGFLRTSVAFRKLMVSTDDGYELLKDVLDGK